MIGRVSRPVPALSFLAHSREPVCEVEGVFPGLLVHARAPPSRSYEEWRDFVLPADVRRPLAIGLDLGVFRRYAYGLGRSLL